VKVAALIDEVDGLDLAPGFAAANMRQLLRAVPLGVICGPCAKHGDVHLFTEAGLDFFVGSRLCPAFRSVLDCELEELIP